MKYQELNHLAFFHCRDIPPPRRSSSPTRAKLTNSCRHSRLVARYNDLYAINRLDMQVYVLKIWLYILLFKNKISFKVCPFCFFLLFFIIIIIIFHHYYYFFIGSTSSLCLRWRHGEADHLHCCVRVVQRRQDGVPFLPNSCSQTCFAASLWPKHVGGSGHWLHRPQSWSLWRRQECWGKSGANSRNKFAWCFSYFNSNWTCSKATKFH